MLLLTQIVLKLLSGVAAFADVLDADRPRGSSPRRHRSFVELRVRSNASSV